MPNKISQHTLLSTYHKQTLIAAVLASTAATITVGLSLPLWIMFIGWIGFSTCSGTPRDCIVSVCCTCCGFTLGILASSARSFLTEHIGLAGVSMVVFSIAIIVLSLRSSNRMGNVTAWFLGVVTYFASQSDAASPAPLVIILTNTFGFCTGFIVKQLQQKIA